MAALVEGALLAAAFLAVVVVLAWGVWNIANCDDGWDSQGD